MGTGNNLHGQKRGELCQTVRTGLLENNELGLIITFSSIGEGFVLEREKEMEG